MSRLFYPHIGGVEKHVMEVSYELIKLGHEVVVITELYDKSLKRIEVVDKITVHRIPVSKNNFLKKFSVWLWMLRHINLFFFADIMHAHDVYYWYVPFKFLLFTKKSFVTFHGYEGKFPISRRAIFQRRLNSYLADGSIAVGKFVEKWYGTKADYVVYGGINPKYQKSNIKNPWPDVQDRQKYISKLKNSDNFSKIIFIGRLDEDTGVNEYIKVLEDLKRRKIKLEFRAFGQGALRKVLERFGNVDYKDDLSGEIENADIIFASSYLSMLEALAQKKLVVAVYQNPLKKDYIRLSPFVDFVISGDNIQVIADEIVRFLESPQKFRDKRERGYDWARLQTWKKLTTQYQKLWTKEELR